MGNGIYVKIKEICSKHRNLILYAIIGFFSSSLDYCAFFFLSEIVGINYLPANCVSVFTGITTSFLLNRAYNFKIKDHSSRRFAIFLCVGLFGLLLSNIILYIGIEIIKFPKLIIKFVSIFFVAGIQYIINKYVTFKYKFEK